MNNEIKELLDQIDVSDQTEFRSYIASGKASDDFIARFNASELYQEVGAKILAKLFEPFAQAIKEADARILNGELNMTEQLWDDKNLVGIKETEKPSNLRIRVVKRDGVSLMRKMDANPDRINVEVENGIITKVVGRG